MTRSRNVSPICPRCGETFEVRGVTQHTRRCFHPRTLERLAEIIGATRTDDGCLIGRHGPDQAAFVGRHQPDLGLRAKRAYAVACELAHGPCPPDHEEVLHSCGRRGCIEPTHLRWGGRTDDPSRHRNIRWRSATTTGA